MVTPTTTANATLTTATRMEACTPTRTRENTSRPSSSVPNQWSPLGGCSAFGTSMSLTPNGAIHDAVTATNTTTTSTTALATVTGLPASSRSVDTRDCSSTDAASVWVSCVMTAESSGLPTHTTHRR